MKEETLKAFEQMRIALANQLGADPAEVVMMISRPHDSEMDVEGIPTTVCTKCWEHYPDESGCDPCPHCGASYFAQIFPGLNCRPRLQRIKQRRRAERRASLRQKH